MWTLPRHGSACHTSRRIFASPLHAYNFLIRGLSWRLQSFSCDHDDSRSFCVLKFRNAPAPNSCAACAYSFARFWSWPRCARVSSFAWSTRRRNRAAPSHSCSSLLRVISALSRRPQNYYVDARFIGNGPRGQLCKMIARMIVDDGASLGG